MDVKIRIKSNYYNELKYSWWILVLDANILLINLKWKQALLRSDLLAIKLIPIRNNETGQVNCSSLKTWILKMEIPFVYPHFIVSKNQIPNNAFTI